MWIKIKHNTINEKKDEENVPTKVTQSDESASLTRSRDLPRRSQSLHCRNLPRVENKYCPPDPHLKGSTIGTINPSSDNNSKFVAFHFKIVAIFLFVIFVSAYFHIGLKLEMVPNRPVAAGRPLIDDVKTLFRRSEEYEVNFFLQPPDVNPMCFDPQFIEEETSSILGIFYDIGGFEKIYKEKKSEDTPFGVYIAVSEVDNVKLLRSLFRGDAERSTTNFAISLKNSQTIHVTVYHINGGSLAFLYNPPPVTTNERILSYIAKEDVVIPGAYSWFIRLFLSSQGVISPLYPVNGSLNKIYMSYTCYLMFYLIWLHSLFAPEPMTLMHIPRLGLYLFLIIYRIVVLFYFGNFIEKNVVGSPNDFSDHLVHFMMLLLILSMEMHVLSDTAKAEGIKAGEFTQIFLLLLKILGYFYFISILYSTFFTALIFHEPMESIGGLAVGLGGVLLPFWLLRYFDVLSWTRLGIEGRNKVSVGRN